MPRRKNLDAGFVMTPAIRAEMTRMRKAGHPSFVKAHRQKREHQKATALLVLAVLGTVGLVVHTVTRKEA